MYVKFTITLIFLQICQSWGICSNDTRFSSEICKGDFNVTCMLDDDTVYCDGFSHRFENSDNKHNKIRVLCEESPGSKTRKRKIVNNNITLVTTDKCKNCLSQTCSGDPYYCDKYSCDTYSECFCELHQGDIFWKHKYDLKPWVKSVPVTVSISMRLDRIFEELPSAYDNYEYNDSPFTYDYEEGPIRNKRFYDNLPDYHWDQPILTIYAPSYEGLVAYADKNTKSVKIPLTTESIEFTFDESWLIDSDNIILRIYNETETSKVLSASLQVFAVRVCSIPDNVFGSDFRNHFSCFPFSLQAIYVMFFVFIAIISGLILAVIVLCCKQCAGGMNISFKLSEQDKAMMLCVLILLPIAVSACDDSLAISASGITCLNDGESESCSVTIQTLATLPFPGFTLCYDVIDAERNVKLGNFSVRLDEVVVQAPMNLLYYTSQWSSRVCANKWCPNSQGCGDDDNCNTFKTWTGYKQVTADEKLTGSCVGYPGVTKCHSSCGCAGCGCFYCSDSCTYIRWSTIPTTTSSGNSTVYSVYSVGSFVRKPKVTICWDDDLQNQKCSTGYFSTNDPVPFGSNFTLTILGNLESSTIALPLPNVMISSDNKNKNFVTASPLNTPTKSQIGDIQASSPSKFTSPSYNSFIVDSSIASCTPSGSGGTCSFASSGVSLFKNQSPKIPGTYNGKMFALSSNKDLIAVDPNPGSTLIRIYSQNFKFVRKVDVVCPKISFVSSFGSYASVDTPRMVLSAYSTCMPGNCVLSSNSISLITPSLSLSTTAKDFEVKLTSTVKKVSGEVCCANLDKRDCITVSFSLDDPIVDPGLNETDDGTNGSLTDDFWNNWSIGSKIGFIIGLAVGLLVLVVLLVLLSAYLYKRGPFEFPKYEKISSDEEVSSFELDEIRTQSEPPKIRVGSESSAVAQSRKNRIIDRFI